MHGKVSFLLGYSAKWLTQHSGSREWLNRPHLLRFSLSLYQLYLECLTLFFCPSNCSTDSSDRIWYDSVRVGAGVLWLSDVQYGVLLYFSTKEDCRLWFRIRENLSAFELELTAKGGWWSMIWILRHLAISAFNVDGSCVLWMVYYVWMLLMDIVIWCRFFWRTRRQDTSSLKWLIQTKGLWGDEEDIIVQSYQSTMEAEYEMVMEFLFGESFYEQAEEVGPFCL